MIDIADRWRRLTDAPARIVDPEVRQKTRLLSGLLLVLIPLGLLASVLRMTLLPDPWPTSLTVTIIAAHALLAAAYGLARAGFYRHAVWVTLGVTAIGCFVAIGLRPGDLMANLFLVVSILLAALLLDELAVWAVTAIDVLVITVLLPVLGYPWPYGDPAVVVLLVIVAGLLLLHIRQRDSLERARQARLAESEAQFRTFFHISPVVMSLTRFHGGQFLDVNRAFEELTGWRREEVIGRTTVELGLWQAPEEHRGMRQAVEQAGTLRHFEWQVHARDGRICHVLASVDTVDYQGERCLLVSAIDITARKQIEQRTARLNRLLQTLAAINPALLRATNEAQLYASICRLLVEQGGFSMAWIGLRDAESPRVRVACQSGFRHGYLEHLEIRCDDSPLGRGPTGTAIRTGQTVVNDDTETNLTFAPWRERAREHGYRSSVALPLRLHEKVIGSLNVYAATPHAFGDDELVLLEKLAGDIGLAVERLRSLARVEASEHELATILQNMQDTYYRTDRDGRIVRASASASRLLGYAPEEVLGRRLADFYVEPDGREKFLAALQAVGGAIQNYEAELRHRDGSVLWVSSNAQFIRDAEGQVTGVEGTVRNVTERKQAELALRQSEEILSKAQEVAHIGSWWWDMAANEVVCSRELLRLYGFPPDLHEPADRLFARIAQIVHPDDREKFQSAMQHVIATGQTGATIEYRVVRPDGEVRTLLAYPEVVRDAEGRAVGTYGALQDITERKQAEQHLLEIARGVSATTGETFFRSLVDHLARALRADHAFVGELITDRPGSIRTIAVLANGRSADNFEYALAGTPCANVVGQSTCAFPRGVQEQFPGDRMLADMGVQAYVGTPLFGAGGEALGLVAVLYRRPIEQDATIGSTLEIFAARAAAELERLRAEAQMRKLSSAIEQTADAVVITDRHGVIEYVNPAFERGTGYRAAEAIGQTPRLVKSGRQSHEFYRTLWQTILRGEVYSNVLINRRKDGTLYYEEKTITPLKDAGGAITHFISTGKDVTERMQTQERLQFLAQHDVLTALPNRTLLLDRLTQSMARARWHRRRVAVLFVDLDRFKTINDTLGHEAGDRLLQQLGERFSRSVREGDTVARFGGDEFVILLSDVATDKDISTVAQKILDALKTPFEIDHQYLYITASIGISLFPNDGEDSSALLKNADIAMYRAKERGKNTYQFYSADMSARAFERLNLETSLRHALERQEFVLHYQPQVEAGSGRIFGVEALLRWQHPDFGLVAPAEFIPLLEETGLIVPVGEWVLEEACRQLQAWRATGHASLRLAVNLSPRQVQSGGLIDAVRHALRLVPDETGWLELEITEGMLVQHSPALLDIFDTLRALGVRLAIDDFGTGYSSLAYLRRFPIDTLKIDRSFVHDVPGDADDSAITTAIIALAQTLRLEVIAEGVENPAQRDFLGAYGCQRMQGYLFARPAPATDITRLFAAGGSGSAPA